MKAFVRTSSAVVLAVVLLVGCGTSGDDSKDQSGSGGPTGLREALREGGIPCDLEYESMSGPEWVEKMAEPGREDDFVGADLVSTYIECSTSRVQGVDLPDDLYDGEWPSAFGVEIYAFDSKADFEEFARVGGSSSCEETDDEMRLAFGDRSGEFLIGTVRGPYPWSDDDPYWADVDIDEYMEEWLIQRHMEEATASLAGALGIEVQEVCDYYRAYDDTGTSEDDEVTESDSASACQIEKRTIATVVAVYYADNGYFPTHIDELVGEFLSVEPTYWTIDGTGADGSSRIVPVGDLPEGCDE